MKHKFKKWHIALMSFIALFIAVFASLFNLKADTVDEETGEVILDNWELGLVFYDSTVNNGNTPLTEINWDASDGGYGYGTSRTIKIQVNYKNDSAVTTYNPGELEITLPNLIYDNYFIRGNETGRPNDERAGWIMSVSVTTNDNDTTGMAWTYQNNRSPGAYSYPDKYTKTLRFINAYTIEEGSNFEGSFQIIYVIRPAGEDSLADEGEGELEKGLDECIHSYFKEGQAELYYEGLPAIAETVTVQSPNYPGKYPNNLNQTETFWEYSWLEADELIVNIKTFDMDTYGKDYLYFYDKEGNQIMYFRSSGYAGRTYRISGNYIKLAMESDNLYPYYTGFELEITPIKKVKSNTITFNYTRTYTHPWQERTYFIRKTAEALKGLDGLGENSDNYIWVKYKFNHSITTYVEYYYPYIAAQKIYIKDSFPENCKVLDSSMNLLTPANGQEYHITPATSGGVGPNSVDTSIYVGYPKSIYNEESNNLNITNTVELYGTFTYKGYEEQLATSTVNINLNNFEFTYNGELYAVSKTNDRSDECFYSEYLLDPDFFHSCGYCFNSHITTSMDWRISQTAVYTGSAMTVRMGDDLLYITDNNSNYRKLNDNEYWFDSIHIPYIYNINNNPISYDKYESNIYVRYAGTTEYVHYKTITQSLNNTYLNIPEKNIVGYYIEIKDLEESVFFSGSRIQTTIKPKNNISEEGRVYNFNYLQVFFKDENRNLILQNEPTIDSYASFITKEEIATFDQETYGTYIQRAVAYNTYTKFEERNVAFSTGVNTSLKQTKQDAEKEIFSGTGTLGYSGTTSSSWEDFITGSTGISDINYIKKVFFRNIDSFDKLTRIEVYDLLPEGLTLTSTKEELLNSITYENSYPYDDAYLYLFNPDGSYAFKNMSEIITFIKEHSDIIIENNYKNTGRTKITWIIDFPEKPLIHCGRSYRFLINYKWELSYDYYLEKGKTWKNYVYLNAYKENGLNFNYSYKTTDNGTYDIQEIDIDDDYIIDEIIGFSSGTMTIDYVVSSHQDVSVFAKTDKNFYQGGTSDVSSNAEYEYKLRVRTGSADVTNLIIHTNIEEAQPERTRWKGEFLGIDISYPLSKGYNVKPYYSENPKAGNLYYEDGTLNSDWQEYTLEQPPQYAQGLEVKFNSQFRTENVSYDYVEIYYILDGITYKLGKWGGTDLAGKTIQVPSNDFYLYWRTDTSQCSYYGFSIDSITYNPIENTNTTTGAIPNYTPEEIKDDTYPDSAFGSYTHGNYGNSVNKVWHYTYTGEKEIIQESTPATNPSLVKSLAFEYLDSNGNPAVFPANSLTYVLIKMKAPDQENVKELARMDCWTLWTAMDDFDRPVDFITGINSNVVKVALPTSVKENDSPFISLKFTKEITGTDSQFENMKLNKADPQTFMIRLTSLIANDDGSYNQITALLKSDQELIISQIPIGTYLLEELGDNYFDFVGVTDNNDHEIIINGVIFEQTDQGYIITVSEDLTENIEFNIKVTNEIEDERFYEYKDNKENLFLKNKIESEDA